MFGFNKKLLSVSLFRRALTISPAYDTTWKYGILQDLKDIGLNGHLPTFIKKNFK